MLNLESFRIMQSPPALMAVPKKKKRTVVKRKVVRTSGKDIASAVFAAIRDEGPICITDIVKITNYSTTSVGYWVEKLKMNDALDAILRPAIGRSRRITYYSLAKDVINEKR